MFPFGLTVLKNLFSKEATRLEKREFFPATRGHVVFDVDSCIFCTLCARKCPAGAITVDRNEKTWSILRASCVQCAACVEACNKNSLSMAPEYTPVMTTKEVETYSAPVVEARGHVVFDVDTCIFCTLCARKCPTGAITVDRNEKTWSILRESCVQCGACAEACKKNSLSMSPEFTPVIKPNETETYHARVSDNQEDSGNS